MNMRVVFLLVRAFFSGTKPIKDFFERISTSRSRIISMVSSFLIVLVFVYLGILLGVNYYSYQTLGLLLGYPYLGLVLAALLGFAFQLFYSLASGTSLLYGAKDILLVGSLAVRHTELGASRLLIAYLLQAPLYWFVTLPSLIVGLWIDGFSLVYLFGGLLFLLVGPLFALSLSVLFSMVLVRLTKGKNHKMAEELVSAVSLVLLILVLTVSLTRNLTDDGSLLSFNYEVMLQSYAPLVEKIMSLFPWFRIQAQMVTSLASQFIILGSGIILFVCLVLLVGTTYAANLSYVLSNQSGTRTRKAKHTFNSSSPQRALMKRELLIIRSESMFVFEIIGELGIPVLLLVLYSFMGILDELAEVVSQLTQTGVFLQLVYLLLLLFANLSMISSTSVSRQGKRFDLDKQYPLDASTFVQAKLLFHLALVFIPHAFFLAVALLLLSLPLLHLLWMIPLSLLCIGMIACLHLAIDYHHPRLDWKVSQQAMKSNLNGLYGMLITFAVLALFALILLLPILVGLSTELSILLLFGLTGLGFSLSYRLALSQARSLLSK